MFFPLLSSEKDRGKALGVVFLQIKETEMLLEKCLAI